METTMKIFLFSMFLFLIIRVVNSTFFTEPNLLRKLNLGDTKFCESILSPTEFTLKKSFEATFGGVQKTGYLNESDRVDLCCRSFHKCEAHKHIELNYTNEQTNIRHCECEYSFKNCLENLNTSSLNVLGFIHTLNAGKCYSIDHPIIECTSFDGPQLEPEMDLRLENLNRCIKYDLDRDQPQQLQMFDVPFNEHATFAFKLIASVRAHASMEEIFSQQKAFDDMRDFKFTNKEELGSYFLKAINATFFAGCSAYNTFINDMEKPPVISMPELTSAADKANAEMERTVKVKMFADQVFKNLLKLLRQTMEVACSNQQLLTNLSSDGCKPNSYSYINNGLTIQNFN